MLVHQSDAAGAEATAQRVMEAMARPFVLDGCSFTVTCSIGIALCPERRRQHGRAAAPRRQGDVQRQGGRPRRLPVPPAAQGRRPALAHAHRPRDAPGAGPGTVPAALPAAGRARERARRGRRGADALARPGDGRDATGRIHPRRRGERLHRRDRRVGARRGGSAGRALAGARAARSSSRSTSRRCSSTSPTSSKAWRGRCASRACRRSRSSSS